MISAIYEINLNDENDQKQKSETKDSQNEGAQTKDHPNPDSLTDERLLNKRLLDLPLAAHVNRASKMSRVVPTAIVMANKGASVFEAKKFLDKEPILRKALDKMKS